MRQAIKSHKISQVAEGKVCPLRSHQEVLLNPSRESLTKLLCLMILINSTNVEHTHKGDRKREGGREGAHFFSHMTALPDQIIRFLYKDFLLSGDIQ